MNQIELTLNTKDFVDAVKRMTPKRVRKVTKNDEVAIFVSNACFMISNRQLITECPLKNENWTGCVELKFNVLLSISLIPPASPEITISFKDGKLKIASLSISAKWLAAPQWISVKKV